MVSSGSGFNTALATFKEVFVSNSIHFPSPSNAFRYFDKSGIQWDQRLNAVKQPGKVTPTLFDSNICPRVPTDAKEFFESDFDTWEFYDLRTLPGFLTVNPSKRRWTSSSYYCLVLSFIA